MHVLCLRPGPRPTSFRQQTFYVSLYPFWMLPRLSVQLVAPGATDNATDTSTLALGFALPMYLWDLSQTSLYCILTRTKRKAKHGVASVSDRAHVWNSKATLPQRRIAGLPTAMQVALSVRPSALFLGQ